MKKVYKKPQIFWEKFKLSTHVAAACDIDFGNNVQDHSNCYATGELEGLGTVQIFAANVNGCHVEEDVTFCQLVQDDHTATFNS